VSTWLDPVCQALDRGSFTLRCFFRDDDVGWAQDRLLAMLDLFERQQVPIDLAVIPTALTIDFSQTLAERIRQGRQPIGTHQHGYAHLNHQTEGRKCEFGESRALIQQKSDIDNGRWLLRELLGELPQPIFTPPWNRCTQITISVLKQLGFKALSRDSSAKPLALDGLHEIPVHIDWLGKRKGERISRTGLGLRIAAVITQSESLGIMLHHQKMDVAELDNLAELLVILASHPRVRLTLMQEWLA